MTATPRDLDASEGVSDVPSPGGFEKLRKVWAPPPGLSRFKEINNVDVGRWYILTGMVFFLAGGIMALMIRAQLAVPEAELLSPDRFNQIFTMHGTTMMFLFAVPIMEAIAVFLLPSMLGARDMPFPRLSAYGYWAYLFGGIIALSSLFLNVAPRSGWFMYPPLSGPVYDPGINADFWLLGIGFVEVAAIAAAVEIIIGIIKFRPPGMTMDRIPIFAWYMLVFGFMILFGFPPLVLADIMLEVERSFDWPFFEAERGGHPLLWQHLFWLFGHPEVYVIFLPAAGVVSTVLPTFVQKPLIGYTWVVLAAVGTGFISFGLWAHHMYATGIPSMSLSFFSAASMAVAIPSGIQVFAWIATMFSGKPILKTPMLFILGFLFIFVLGGLTGVMVASVPFDWQVHDTYFIVAHLHYVLIGGMVFPLFAGLYYWMPLMTGRMMSEILGRWTFWLMFAGFNIAFFPMHITGLRGMPRRVYTYPAEFGWDWLNLVSSVGAFMFAAGVAVFVFDFWRHRRQGPEAGYNPWNAGTLEWVTPTPAASYGLRSIPSIKSHYPLWDDPKLADAVARGECYLPDAASGRRETLRTSTVQARPEQVLRLPHPTWLPFLSAFLTALVFGFGILKLWLVSLVMLGVLALTVMAWLWRSEDHPRENLIPVGHGLRLPVHVNGTSTHSYWAVVLTLIFDGTTYLSLVFAYFFIWTVNPEWPPPDFGPNTTLVAAGAAVALVASSILFHASVRAVPRAAFGTFWAASCAALVLLAAGSLLAAFSLVWAGVDPTRNAYSAIIWMMVAWMLFHAMVSALMTVYCMARVVAGKIDPDRWQSLLNTIPFWHFTTGVGVLSIAITYLFPMMV